MVFPKILFSCQQDEPIPPGMLWALAGWHSMGCIILSPGSAAAQGTPGLLCVVFILLLEALQDKPFAVFPFTLLVLSATLLSSSGSPGRVPGVLLAQIPEVWCKQQQKQQRLDQLDHSCQLICFWCCIKTRLTLHMTRIIYDVFPTFTSPPLVHNPFNTFTPSWTVSQPWILVVLGHGGTQAFSHQIKNSLTAKTWKLCPLLVSSPLDSAETLSVLQLLIDCFAFLNI